MLDFDVPLLTGISKVKTEVGPSVEVTEQARIVSHEQRGFTAKESANWNWTDLRDYIVTEIEKRHGPQLRDAIKESGICKSFISRWGIEQAVAIAKAAFEIYDGMWKNTPISITRFSKNSDVYFANIIAAAL